MLEELIGQWVVVTTEWDDDMPNRISGKGILSMAYYGKNMYTVQVKDDRQIATMILRFREDEVEVTKHKQYAHIKLCL